MFELPSFLDLGLDCVRRNNKSSFNQRFGVHLGMQQFLHSGYVPFGRYFMMRQQSEINKNHYDASKVSVFSWQLSVLSGRYNGDRHN